ncbi:MAG: hypothetical protein WC795_00670 [Candidatus Paceibacterota bacterium]|jgi:hypothetical protein
MARVNFDSIFIIHPDGSLEPRQRVRVGGVEFGPGVRFQNTSFGGINFHDPQFFNKDLEIKTDNDTTAITGVY